jgi:putative transposase
MSPCDKLGLLGGGVREEAIYRGEEQIVCVLQEAQAGMSARDVCRKHNVSEQSFYRWKAKYGGMGVSEVRRLRELERENTELKKIMAEQTLDIRMLKDVNAKNSRPSRTTTCSDALARPLQDQ